MDQVLWSYTGDRFHCKLELAVEKKGQLVLFHGAGADLQFRFEPQNLRPAKVSASATPAPWSPYRSDEQRSDEQRPFIGTGTGFQLGAPDARALLDRLDDGSWLSLLLDDRELRIPAIRWRQTMVPFHDCQERLSPLSVAQARDQVLFYRTGQRALTEDQLQQLSRLARYVQLDPGVSRILVDSYTDNTGSRLANLQLSRERAADVAAALQAAGVPEAIIERRAHGERFPSAHNSTEEGRDLSRRVNLRIVRQETEDAL